MINNWLFISPNLQSCDGDVLLPSPIASERRAESEGEAGRSGQGPKEAVGLGERFKRPKNRNIKILILRTQDHAECSSNKIKN